MSRADSYSVELFTEDIQLCRQEPENAAVRVEMLANGASLDDSLS